MLQKRPFWLNENVHNAEYDTECMSLREKIVVKQIQRYAKLAFSMNKMYVY